MKKLIETYGFCIGCLLVLLTLCVACGLSWILTCGIVYLICLCFGWTFSWAVATGGWLIACLISGLFRNNN